MNFWGGVVGSISFPGSSVTRKASDVVSDPFPAGLRVLVVDDDRTCLTILGRMLQTCNYEVTKCKRAEVALSLLRENKNGYDIVLSDVHMPDMDGFKLLEYIGLEMDLPVIMMSADDSKNVVMKGVTHGACDYLIKPVRMEALKNIWQHVVRKKKNEWKELEQSGSLDEGDRQQKQDDSECSSAGNEGSWKSSKRKGEDEEAEEKDDTAMLKKPRVVWSVELHQQFVTAVNQLDIDKAVPKKILELMNVPGLTRENVASHLQKYRLYLRRLSGVPQHQGGLNNSFMGPQDPSFGTMPSLSGIDLQALAVAGHLLPQTLATYQAAGLGRPGVKPGISMPFIDQRNHFSFENPKLRFGEGQQQQQPQQQQQFSNSNVKQLNLLHGIPTSMEPKQLAALQQSSQPLGSLNNNLQGSTHGSSQGSSLLMQMVQPQPRGQMPNETIGSQISQIQSTVGQSMPRNGMAESGQGVAYNLVSQATLSADFSVNNVTDYSGDGFPLGSTLGITSLTSKGFVQGGISSDMKGARGYTPSYDIFNELQQHKAQDWQLQNATLDYVAPPHSANSVQNAMNVAPSVLVHQAFSNSSEKSVQNSNGLVGRTMFSAGAEPQLGGTNNINQNVNSLLIDNNSRVKVERVQEVSSGTGLFSNHLGEDDLMSALLKQQGGFGHVESEFDFDGYTRDNIPV
ncbi:hypothetical protein Ancab_030137 [Ancistrocladus abbreviatus]